MNIHITERTSHKQEPLHGADLHINVIGYIRREVERLSTLSGGKNGASHISDLAVRICDFVDKCVQKGAIHTGNADTVLAYHVPFWTQALLKKNTTRLRFDCCDSIEYPPNKKKFPHIPLTSRPLLNQLLRLAPKHMIWKYLVKNYSENEEKYTTLMGDLRKKGYQKVLFLGNHATWLNLPMHAHFLTKNKIDPDTLYTVVGPAIMTTEMTAIGATFQSTVLKTWPKTQKGATGFPGTGKIVKGFLRRRTEINKQESIYYLISPSGTTDTESGGRLYLAKPSGGTMSLLQEFADEGFVFVCIGTNDLEVMTKNASIKPGNVYMNWKICTTSNQAMSTLPGLVMDSGGVSIASWQEK